MPYHPLSKKKLLRLQLDAELDDIISHPSTSGEEQPQSPESVPTHSDCRELFPSRSYTPLPQTPAWPTEGTLTLHENDRRCKYCVKHGARARRELIDLYHHIKAKHVHPQTGDMKDQVKLSEQMITASEGLKYIRTDASRFRQLHKTLRTNHLNSDEIIPRVAEIVENVLAAVDDLNPDEDFYKLILEEVMRCMSDKVPWATVKNIAEECILTISMFYDDRTDDEILESRNVAWGREAEWEFKEEDYAEFRGFANALKVLAVKGQDAAISASVSVRDEDFEKAIGEAAEAAIAKVVDEAVMEKKDQAVLASMIIEDTDGDVDMK